GPAAAALSSAGPPFRYAFAMLFVLFTLEDFIGVRKLSRARESSPPRSARGRHSAGAVGHSVGGKVAVTTNRWEVQHETWRSVAIRTLRRRPPHLPRNP